MTISESPPELTHFKLEKLLRKLTKTEIKEFRKFINSPVYSKGRLYQDLLNQYLKLINRKKRAGGEIKGSRTLKNRTSELYKLAEEFLIYNTLQKKKIEKDLMLLEAMFEKNLTGSFENKMRQTKRKIEMLPIGDEKFQYNSSSSKLNIAYLKEKLIFGKLYAPYYSQATSTICTLLNNLFEYGIEFIQQEMANKKYEFNIVKELLARIKLDELISSMENKEDKLFRLVTMNYYFYKAFENPSDEKKYFKARKIFEQIRSALSNELIISHYSTMTNYCILRQNQGENKFRDELFKLYNERLKLGIYSDEREKVFPNSTFRNYVMLGIMMKKTDWTNDFIRRYSKELPAENREDEIKLSYSRLEFGNKNYRKVLQNLIDIKGATYLHYCDCSVLKLCSYYETEMFEEAFSEVDKLRHYLKNHAEIPRIHREYFVNFLKVYQGLLNARTKLRKGSKEIKPLIENVNHISRKLWLEEKILELENN